jgi:hypothetical protein
MTMAGTGDQMISAADKAVAAAQREYDRRGREQASPGHSDRLKEAEIDLGKAKEAAKEARRRWG